MNRIKQVVEELEDKLDKIQDLWTVREKELGQKAQVSELESAMKTVSYYMYIYTRIFPLQYLLR